MISIATCKSLYGNCNYYNFFLNFGSVISFSEAAILSSSTNDPFRCTKVAKADGGEFV